MPSAIRIDWKHQILLSRRFHSKLTGIPIQFICNRPSRRIHRLQQFLRIEESEEHRSLCAAVPDGLADIYRDVLVRKTPDGENSPIAGCRIALIVQIIVIRDVEPLSVYRNFCLLQILSIEI